MKLQTRDDAIVLLKRLGAPSHLLRHVELVGEAADLLLSELRAARISVSEDFVRVGVVLHDVGKIHHPQEMSQPGSLHEPEGEKMLLEAGAPPDVARVCLSHARWGSMECSLEELLIALSDKLWKGVRRADLEEAVIRNSGERSGRDYWDLFVSMDSCFERIADEGAARLVRSTS